METSAATISVDDDPWIIVHHADYPPERGWKIERSKLTQHSGFFKRMFRQDCVETRKNVVSLHDDDLFAVSGMLACIESGRMLFTARRGNSEPGDWNNFELHENAARLYQIMDKYDCALFMDKCRQALVGHAKYCLDDGWDDEGFMAQHYEEIASWYGGEYPEELYPVLAEVWRKFSTMNRACPKLDAAIKGDPALAVAIAKSYRARLYLVADNVAATKEALETSV